MSNNLDQLLERWKATTLPLSVVREHYFAHIGTDKHLRALIRKGKVKLPTYKFTDSRLEPPHVRLRDLADFLDTQTKPADTPPGLADQQGGLAAMK
ncbi:Pyocin activator protein PrtN [compost metagenome]